MANRDYCFITSSEAYAFMGCTLPYDVADSLGAARVTTPHRGAMTVGGQVVPTATLKQTTTTTITTSCRDPPSVDSHVVTAVEKLMSDYGFVKLKQSSWNDSIFEGRGHYPRKGFVYIAVNLMVIVDPQGNYKVLRGKPIMSLRPIKE